MNFKEKELNKQSKQKKSEKNRNVFSIIKNISLREIALLLFSILLWLIMAFQFYFLIWVVFVPIFLLLLRAERKKSMTYTFLYSVAVSFIQIYWVSDYHEWAFLLVLFLHIITFLVFLNLGVYLIKKASHPYGIFILPALWGLLLLLFHLTPLGNFALLYAFYQPTLGPLMHWLTSYGITLLIILSNSLIIHYYHAEKDMNLIYAKILLLSIVFSFFVYSSMAKVEGEPLKVALVQANQQQGWSYRIQNSQEVIENHIELTKQIINQKPQIVIWPEYAISTDLSQDEDLKKKMIEFSKSSNLTLIAGSLLWLGKESWGYKEHQDILWMIEPDGKMQQYIAQKPLIFEFAVKGSDNEAVLIWKNQTIGVQICFEEMQTPLQYQMKKYDPSFIISISNNNAFTDFRYGLEYASQYTKLQAAEQQTYVLRATNTGITQIINPYGKVVANLEPNGEGVLVGEIFV